MKTLLVCFWIFGLSVAAAASPDISRCERILLNEGDAITGVWKLTAFNLDDGKGNITPWSEGAYGVLIYTQGYMSVAINSESEPAKMVHYSGPYHLEGNTVVHDVKNFSSPALKQVFRRSVEMADADHLDLIGPFGDGGKAIISWQRMQSAPPAEKQE